MRIIIDGDACPGRNIIESAAKKFNIEVILYCDINHMIKSDYIDVRYVDSGFQRADMAIFNEVKENDIVVTQDFGVSAVVLSKKAYAINPKGYIYDNDNIDSLLYERYVSSKIRRAGGKTASPKKRKSEDNERLERNLIKLIKQDIL